MSVEIADEEKRRRVLHLTCCLLPKAHRDSAEILFHFLNWTASFSQVDEEVGSKMDTHNLATVITPNILKQAETGGKSAPVDDSFLAIEAVHMLIDYNDQMCEVSHLATLRTLPSTSLELIHISITLGSRRSPVAPRRSIPLRQHL